MRVAGWRIRYVGGHVYEGTTFEAWTALPSDGVLTLMVYYDKRDGLGRPTRMELNGDDNYFSTPDGVLGSSNDSVESITERYPGASIKRGKWAPIEELAATQAAARADYLLPT